MITLTIDCPKGRQIHELSDGIHTIGRSARCDVQIPIDNVSRRHGEIRVEGDRVFIRDVGSGMGTALDWFEVGDAFLELKPGWRVHMGEAILELNTQGRKASSDPEDSTGLYSRPLYDVKSGLGYRARVRVSRMFSRLLEIMSLSGSPKEVGRSACRMVAGMIHADQVFIEMRRGPGYPLEALAGWPDMPSSAEDAPRGHHVRNLVIEDRQSLLIPILPVDERFDEWESCHGLTTAMAVPLFDGHHVLGILYVDSTDSGQHYCEEDLQVVTAVAGTVAVRLRDILLHDKLRTASAIQRAILPHKLPEISGYEIDAHLTTCEDVGGDLYQLLERPNGDWLLALGDVSGKGMPAALDMGATTVLLRSLAALGLPMETLVAHLHEQLYASFSEENHVTLFLASLDSASGDITYVGAAHEALVLSEGGDLRRLESTGMPIGLWKDAGFDLGRTTLRPGDLLAICSDGVDEATADGEEFFGVDRYVQLLREGRALPLPALRKSIFEAILDFVGPDGASDDITLLLVRRRGG